MVGMVPKKDAPGVDFCGVDQYYYIVRSDLGCYMRSTNFNKGEDLVVYSLHFSCRNGDHYLAHEDDLFYIIKGTNYRRVTNMNTDEGAVVYALHPSCRGGDHYLSAFGHFYIIDQSRGVYRKTTNMNTYEDGVEYTLHPNCRDGLYYFGVKNYYYFVKPHDEWGVQYYKCTDFSKDENGESFSINPTVTNFVPGGLALIRGPSFGVWECIKTITNDSQSPITWTNKINKKVGYEKEKMSSIEHNWNVSATVSAETGGLSALVVKSQFSLSTSYGGSSVNTERENWNEVTETEETISLTVKPNEKIYVWQYKLGLGKEAVLFCRDMKFDDDPKPPTENPLPPAN
ncbi:Hypothetical predicted protein [Pelobates cultripes]|uniref:Uncharacterized protein n=1 Tax=Pelobates cultripes TaxID=61616 RepID=A0AAD1SNF3_PELCU|nr:Hypothetical predicted protein [Pelobates cultripes]